ncbi:MAG: hypothetical protein P8I94_04375 [Emcibacteraceae bacterium]|nr:hypothetical protein [Emcibacteraceae bacterium]
MEGNTQKRTEVAKLKMLNALEKTLGIVTNALKIAEVSRSQFYFWVREDEDFAKKVKEMDNLALDFAESSLYKQVKDGNPSSTQFLLKNKGRDRGYGDKLDITTGGDKINKIEIEIVKPKDKNE